MNHEKPTKPEFLKINEDRIAYYQYHSQKNPKKPCIIFLHGLMSDMNGNKAIKLEKFCEINDINFLRFDNLGHGESSRKFEDTNITSWLYGLECIGRHINDSKMILVGSSMGGWIAMLYAIKYPNRVAGIVTLAAAPDFSEELLWNKLAEEEKNILKEKGQITIKAKNPDCETNYNVKYDFIIDAKKHLIMQDDNIDIKSPIHIIHGIKDDEVPYNTALRITDKINHGDVVTKLIKDGDHRLSRDSDINIITNSIEEIIKNI